MSKFIKKLFGALSDKPWNKEQMALDNFHQGKTFDISNQTSAVIVIFGVSTVLFSLIVTGYLYSTGYPKTSLNAYQKICRTQTIIL